MKRSKPVGLYLHIPFCKSKCPYCDFYSFVPTAVQMERYTDALIAHMRAYADDLPQGADTLYVGGGTPSVLAPPLLKRLVTCAQSTLLLPDSEITVECNPTSANAEFVSVLQQCGVNRLSVGLQSAVASERAVLGRKSDADDVRALLALARTAGIENISLDVMLGIPGNSREHLKHTLDFCLSTGVPHISCYMLKLEAGTPFYEQRNQLALPAEDAVAEDYLFMCDYLEANGLLQYEISNFARPGFESRHNLKYWHTEPYLGLGASAHSFIGGKRFYFPRDVQAFVDGCLPILDGTGGEFAEYAMLALRLRDGLSAARVRARYGFSIPRTMLQKAEQLQKLGLIEVDEAGLRLTKNGFLLSNSVLAELL